MTRTTSEGKAPNLVDDQTYTAAIKSAVIEKSKNPQYPEDQLKLVLVVDNPKHKNGDEPEEIGDYLSLKLGMRADGTASKLRQLLNALAERDRSTELWFDPETLEWGYDMKTGSAPYSVLRAGDQVRFRGEKRKNQSGKAFYKITAYRAVKSD